MDIDTKYAVKLFFANSTFLQVFFEAVANSLDAEATAIEILVSSDGQISPDHLEIKIKDNGRGFTEERFERFRRLTEPNDPYHKGLGRLVYLRHFSTVHVSSVFDGKRRTFTFANTFKGESKTVAASSEDQPGTVLRFSGFIGRRLSSYDDIKPAVLKSKLLEHFLPLLHEKKVSGSAFRIGIDLETRSAKAEKDFFPDTQSITVDDVPALQCRAFRDPSLDVFADISMWYMLRQGSSEKQQLAAACIDGRTIPFNKLLSPNAIPPNHTAIFLFKSELFAGKSDSARQRLVLPENISEPALYRILRREMSAVLNEELPEIGRKNAETRRQFEDKYPHLVGLFEEDTVGLIDRDEAIELAQRRFFKDQKDVLESASLDDATYEKSLEVSSRALTEYVLYRELIIRRLAEITDRNKESDIHNLLVPRYERFGEGDLLDGIYRNNAWLLDDKFMTFRTILSEARMRDLISAITLKDDVGVDDGRPDISMIFSADPAEEMKVDVVVVEIKRRVVDERENTYAALQLAKRARLLVNHCPTIQRVWYFAIIEIDDALSQLLMDTNWIPLFSKGRVFYQDYRVERSDGVRVPTPTCLVSYDAIIKDAAARNHTFLEILKSDIKRGQSERRRDRS